MKIWKRSQYKQSNQALNLSFFGWTWLKRGQASDKTWRQPTSLFTLHKFSWPKPKKLGPVWIWTHILPSSSLPTIAYRSNPDRFRCWPRPKSSFVHCSTPVLSTTLQGRVTRDPTTAVWSWGSMANFWSLYCANVPIASTRRSHKFRILAIYKTQRKMSIIGGDKLEPFSVHIHNIYPIYVSWQQALSISTQMFILMDRNTSYTSSLRWTLYLCSDIVVPEVP